MRNEKKLLAVVVAYNTGEWTKKLLSRFPAHNDFDVIVINDGSTDNTQKYVSEAGFRCITHPLNRGLGAALKSGIRYALDNDYYALAILAGNNKDDPSEIKKLFAPITEEGYNYIQGSRFVRGGRWDNLPAFRYVMVKIHAWVMFCFTGFRGTDALNGFRAYTLDIFRDRRINAWQDWLDKYEFETYLHYKVLTLGFKVKEVPVSKIYPKERFIKKSHIRPFIDWWKIMSPLVYLKLGLRS